MSKYQNPTPTVDIIIQTQGGIVFIRRKNDPAGTALPGGFVDTGELLEQAALREAKEETGLDVELTDLLYVYSHPQRDPRQHTLSAVYIARADGHPVAGDDAGAIILWDQDNPPTDLVFDHEQIYQDYLRFQKTGQKPRPAEILARLPGYEQ